MTERKVTVRDQTGNEVSGTVIDIIESVERFSEIKLSNGWVLKVKHVAVEVVQLDGLTDQEGNPVFQVKGANIINVSQPVSS